MMQRIPSVVQRLGVAEQSVRVLLHVIPRKLLPILLLSRPEAGNNVKALRQPFQGIMELVVVGPHGV